MTNNVNWTKIYRCISASSLILKSLLVVPIEVKKMQNLEISKGLNLTSKGISAIALFSTYTYSYFSYIHVLIKEKSDPRIKWVIYFAVIIVMLEVLLIYQTAASNKFKSRVEGYYLPLSDVFKGIIFLPLTIHAGKCDDIYKDLGIALSLYSIFHVKPLYELTKKDDEAFVLIQVVNALMLVSSGIAGFVTDPDD